MNNHKSVSILHKLQLSSIPHLLDHFPPLLGKIIIFIHLELKESTHHTLFKGTASRTRLV